ncbi:hypothetical protein [Providencia rettgeri]|uniref:hypothetical protein n=1 Tax=Providencia rettgeri TaxID=587 RepID=UPI00301831A0
MLKTTTPPPVTALCHAFDRPEISNGSSSSNNTSSIAMKLIAIRNISNPDIPALVNHSPHIIIDMPSDEDDTNINPASPNYGLIYFKLHAKNVGIVLARNLASVGIPTGVREYVRRAVLPTLFSGISPAARVSIGGIAMAAPVVLQLIGIARDIHAGTQTVNSLRSRLANIALVVGTGTTLAATGGLSAAANALIAAVFVYVPLRDLSQYFLQLGDNNKPEVNFNATALSAAAYMGNQAAVDHGMEILSKTLTPVIGELAANILGRAIINIGGETVDELTNRGLHARAFSNPKLKFNIGFRPKEKITCETAIDHVLNTLTGRASLFSAAYAGAYATPTQGILNSMVVGAILGAGYIPFVYSHEHKQPKHSYNLEQIAIGV